jgi:hypothetical protein
MMRARIHGKKPSDIATSVFSIGLSSKKIPTPIINPPNGTYETSKVVSISCDLTSAAIRYTADGSQPTTTSKLYTGQFEVTSSTTIRAKAFQTGWSESNEASSKITIIPQTASNPIEPSEPSLSQIDILSIQTIPINPEEGQHFDLLITIKNTASSSVNLPRNLLIDDINPNFDPQGQRPRVFIDPKPTNPTTIKPNEQLTLSYSCSAYWNFTRPQDFWDFTGDALESWLMRALQRCI